MRKPVLDFLARKLAPFELVIAFCEQALVELDPGGDDINVSRVDKLEKNVFRIGEIPLPLVMED